MCGNGSLNKKWWSTTNDINFFLVFEELNIYDFVLDCFASPLEEIEVKQIVKKNKTGGVGWGVCCPEDQLFTQLVF